MSHDVRPVRLTERVTPIGASTMGVHILAHPHLQARLSGCWCLMPLVIVAQTVSW